MEELKNNRNYNIDLIKFFCAFGVICTHTKNSTNEADIIGSFFAPFRVPFFLIIALVFFISGFKKIELSTLFNKIWVRIVIPYLVWSLIYMALIVIKNFMAHKEITNEWWQILFFGASAVQLYFIPKILVMQGFALGLILILKENLKRKIIGLIIFIISFIWLYIGVTNNRLGFNNSDYEVIVIYLLIAFFISQLKDKNLFNGYYAILGGLLFIIIMILKFYLSSKSIFTNYYRVLGGVSFTLLAFTLPNINISKKAGTIIGYSYGIYLSHIIFLEGFELFFKVLKINVFYNVAVKLIFSVSILCASIVFTYLIKKNDILKKYLLGE